jgi:beta-galactosidase
LSVPDWPEARGLSPSDLRWRCYLDTPPWVLRSGAELGADGLLGRKAVGKGVAVFCQLDPDGFQADEKTYFRYTRWRATRAVAQLLANLGASFTLDSRVFSPVDPEPANPEDAWQMAPNGDRCGPQASGPRAHPKPSSSPGPEAPRLPPFYHADYRTDFPMGDNPYRYYRW